MLQQFSLQKMGKYILALVWIFLFISLLKRDFFIPEVDRVTEAISAAKSVNYQAIYFKKEKIGWVISKYKPLDNGLWQLHQEAEMRLNVAGKIQNINLNLEAELKGDGLLRNFTFHFTSPFYSMKADGTVHDKTVDYQLNTGATTIKNSLEFPQPPILTSSRRAYLLQAEMKVGEKRKIPWFDPFTLTGKESIVRYQGIESVRINGRVRRLHRFSESLAGSWIDFWLDDEGETIKEKSPAGFVFIKEPKFKALSKSDGGGKELLAAVAITPQKAMPKEYKKLTEMSYRLNFPEGNFQLDSGRQHFQKPVLTVNKQSSREETVNEEERLPSPSIQSDNEEIITRAKEIIAGVKTEYEKAEKLNAWLFANIKKQPVLGLPDAVTVLHTMQGDCNEHATLLAALARAVDIPGRIAAGVVYTDWGGAFYYHAWNELFIDGRWLAVDSALNQIPADISHIKFVEGELSKQTEITALIGQLQITPLEEQSENKGADSGNNPSN